MYIVLYSVKKEKPLLVKLRHNDSLTFEFLVLNLLEKISDFIDYVNYKKKMK